MISLRPLPLAPPPPNTQEGAIIEFVFATTKYMYLHYFWGGIPEFLFITDKNTMIRNRYNRIQHLALNTKRKRDTYNYDGTKQNSTGEKPRGQLFPNRWPQGYPK